MIVIDHTRSRVYECSRRDAAVLMRCTPQTLYNWQRRYKYEHRREDRTVMFTNAIRFKQKKGFALGQPKNSNRFKKN